VAFTGRSADKGAEVEAELLARGGQAMYVRADSGVEEEVASAVQVTVARYGRLTTLVNNAISDDACSGKDSHRPRRQRHVRNHPAHRTARHALGVQVRGTRDARGGKRLDREHLREFLEIRTARTPPRTTRRRAPSTR